MGKPKLSLAAQLEALSNPAPRLTAALPSLLVVRARLARAAP